MNKEFRCTWLTGGRYAFAPGAAGWDRPYFEEKFSKNVTTLEKAVFALTALKKLEIIDLFTYL